MHDEWHKLSYMKVACDLFNLVSDTVIMSDFEEDIFGINDYIKCSLIDEVIMPFNSSYAC